MIIVNNTTDKVSLPISTGKQITMSPGDRYYLVITNLRKMNLRLITNRLPVIIGKQEKIYLNNLHIQFKEFIETEVKLEVEPELILVDEPVLETEDKTDEVKDLIPDEIEI